MSYDYSFASVYDVFTAEVNYEDRANYIYEILTCNKIENGTVLDVSCGTGSFSKCFLDKGFEVVANDISVNMLNIAREKLSVYGDRVLLLCQDMCELDLFGTVDAAICCLDSVNHLLDKDDVQDAFFSIGKFIRPGGIFVFDVNTLYKHREILSDKTFVYEDDEDAMLIWQNSECDCDDVVEMYIDIFTADSDGKYIRSSDYVAERAYSTDFIKECLVKAGFTVQGIYDDMKNTAPSDKSERIYFVAEKK